MISTGIHITDDYEGASRIQKLLCDDVLEAIYNNDARRIRIVVTSGLRNMMNKNLVGQESVLTQSVPYIYGIRAETEHSDSVCYSIRVVERIHIHPVGMRTLEPEFAEVSRTLIGRSFEIEYREAPVDEHSEQDFISFLEGTYKIEDKEECCEHV